LLKKKRHFEQESTEEFRETGHILYAINELITTLKIIKALFLPRMPFASVQEDSLVTGQLPAVPAFPLTRMTAGTRHLGL